MNTQTEFRSLRESNDIVQDRNALVNRLQDDGYLFFRRLLPKDKLLDLRRQMMELMQRGGWIQAGTDPLLGLAQPDAQCTEGDPKYTDIYHEVYKLKGFHEIPHLPVIMDLIERILGGTCIPQPQKVARLWFPNYTEHTTPIHQDFVHFQGNTRNLTAWSPVGDCPIELGGLAILQGSHRLNRVVDHGFSLGAGSLAIDLEQQQIEGEWHTTNYELGDTLIFPAVTIHQALPNVTEDKLRVSFDNRYQLVSDQIAYHMTQPHLQGMNPINWDDIYEDWDQDDPLKYYWQELPMPIIPKDETFSKKGFEEAVQLAKVGNAKAIHHLQRYIARAPDSVEGQRAEQVLAGPKS